jgi:hypothetical protein
LGIQSQHHQLLQSELALLVEWRIVQVHHHPKRHCETRYLPLSELNYVFEHHKSLWRSLLLQQKWNWETSYRFCELIYVIEHQAS